MLFEMDIALPQDPNWNAFDNKYNHSAYERICKEFFVDISANWRQKQSDNQGLGRIYNYWTNIGYRPFDEGTEYDSRDYLFTHATTNDILHIDYIAQGPEAKNAWSTFILDDSKGFTRASVERINDSIRTYCWAILGSQSQTRTDILGTGTAFDAQKQFLANIEDAINSPVDLPSQIARYQNTLKYARSKVDFVYGVGLYMSPSNMELQIGTIQDYNNKIEIANDVEGLSLGLNNGAKSEPTPPPRPTSPVRGTKTKQSLPEPDPTPRPTPAYRKQVHAYAKMHNLPQSWVDGICADPTGFERWRAARSKAQKIHQKQEVKRRSGWKQEHPNQSKEHFYLHPTRELLLPGNV